MLTLDSNNILSIWQTIDEWKQFTRSFFGYPISAFNHTVLVYHKKQIIQKQWKDVGAGQSVCMMRKISIANDTSVIDSNTSVIASEAKQSSEFKKLHTIHPEQTTCHPELDSGSHQPTPLNKWLARIWFDILYKYDEQKWETINIAKPDATVELYANTAFGTSRTALVMPSYENCLLLPLLHSFLFGIALAHGKWTIKNNELFPIKITIPLTSSLLGKKEFFEKMTDALRHNHIIHTVNYSQTPTYEIMQLTLHDPVLLDQFSQWLNPIVKITQISTLNHTQKVYETLLTYAHEQELILPIASASELIVLEAD
jgi:hypothetical protein